MGGSLKYKKKTYKCIKALKDILLEGLNDKPYKKYEKDIIKYLDSRKWDDAYDIVAEFEYGDEYYGLVYGILDHLDLKEGTEDYDDIYYGVGPLIKMYMKKNKLWK